MRTTCLGGGYSPHKLHLRKNNFAVLLHLLIPCLLLALSAWAGGATTCRPGTYSLPHSDPLPPQGGTGLPRLISGSSGCPPGWLCSGKLRFIQYDGLEKSQPQLLSLSYSKQLLFLKFMGCKCVHICFFSPFYQSQWYFTQLLRHSLCFSQVLSCILDPLLQLCTVSASNLGTADMATYMVNSLYVMKTTLALFEFTDKRLEMLEFQVCPNCKQLPTN